MRLAVRNLIPGIIFLTSAAIVQSQTPTATGMGSYHPYEIAGIYAHMLTDGSYGLGMALNGWTASASAGVLSRLQATGEFGSYSARGVSLKSFLGGPQVRFHIYRFEPFVRGLFGISHTAVNSHGVGSSFTIATGGGVNFPITDQLSIRALQVDYYRPYGGYYRAADFLRVGFGVSYQFGTR